MKSAARRCQSWLISPHAAYFVAEPLFWLLGRRKKSQHLSLFQCKQVLVVRLDEIGDVVMTMPFLRELRRNLPEAWITLIVKPAVYNLVELCPYVNEVLSYDWDAQGNLAVWRRHWRALRMARRFWRRNPIDLALLPRWDSDIYHGAYLVNFSGAPMRVGYSESVNESKRQINAGYDALFTDIMADHGPAHEVERNLNLLRHIGGTIQSDRLELWLDQEDETFAEDQLAQSGHETLIAFGVGQHDPKRMWPITHFVELGNWLAQTLHARTLIVGGREESLLGEALAGQLGDVAINMCGQTILRQTGALLKRCQLYVGIDTGSMHLAAAAGVPVIEISCHPKSGSPAHANSPKRFKPWGVPSMVLQPEHPRHPCTDGCAAAEAHCILGITANMVKDAIMTQLRQQAVAEHL